MYTVAYAPNFNAGLESVPKKQGFTLIELIIVVVIIGILALVAIPRYFANINKAQKSQVLANLAAIKQAQLAYYAVYGTYTAVNAFPITVVLDGDTLLSVPNPTSSDWYYSFSPTCSMGCPCTSAQKLPGYTCYYDMCVNSSVYQQNCF